MPHLGVGAFAGPWSIAITLRPVVRRVTRPEVAAKYVQAFVESAGQVSPVFERKARDILADNGLNDLDGEDWLPLDSFTDGLAEIEAEVGDKTLTMGGVEMATSNDMPDSVSTISDALVNLNTSHQNAHRNGSASDWGSYGCQQLQERRFRMSCSDTYPYPHVMTKGVFKGVVEEFADGNVSMTIRQVEDSDLGFDEGCAYDITW